MSLNSKEMLEALREYHIITRQTPSNYVLIRVVRHVSA